MKVRERNIGWFVKLKHGKDKGKQITMLSIYREIMALYMLTTSLNSHPN